LQNSQRLANRLESKLQGLQGSLDALIQGQVPITFTGYFGAGPAGPAGRGAMPAPVLAPTAPLATGPSLPVPPQAVEPGPPVFTALARAFTVKDVWREWREGLAGQPAI
jgi:hypothetical protein